jgi:O-antigen/teichoic acid export membrane protein
LLDKLKPKSEFSRNVLPLMTGTTIAQAIPIAISPILTRIYTPEDFGIFALYMSLVSIIAVVATGRYELAIMLPKKDEDAANIVALSIIISFFVSFITLLVVIIWNVTITKLLGHPEISNWLYFIPLSILLSGLYQSFNYWNNRKKQYKRLSYNRVIRSTSTATVNLGMGFSGFGSSGLIFGGILGQFMATFFLAKFTISENKNMFGSLDKLKIFVLAKKYIKFPKYDIWATLANVMSHQVVHILFNILISLTVSGYYYLVQKIMGMPTVLISSAISDVFREEASTSFKKNGNAKHIFEVVFKKLFLLSIIPFLFLLLFVQDLFIIVFGANWSEAGLFAQILTPMFFLQFIASPLSYILYITDNQKLNLLMQLGMFFFVLLSFLCGYIFVDTYLIIILISSFTSMMYIVYIIMSYHKSKGDLK